MPESTISKVLIEKPTEWGWQKVSLIFAAALAESLAKAPALPFHWGPGARAIAGILAAAFITTFAYLLKPPTQQPTKPEPIQGEENRGTQCKPI